VTTDCRCTHSAPATSSSPVLHCQYTPPTLLPVQVAAVAACLVLMEGNAVRRSAVTGYRQPRLSVAVMVTVAYRQPSDLVVMTTSSQQQQQQLRYSQYSTHTHTHTHTHTQPFNGPLSRTIQVCRYQSSTNPTWILLKQETVSGGGISWAIICKSASRSRQITTPAPHHPLHWNNNNDRLTAFDPGQPG